MLARCKIFRIRAASIAVLLTLAFLSSAEASYMLAKARLAQILIEQSWNRAGGPPWPWADTKLIAHLVVPEIELDSYVLSGATGATLAFGPGMLSGSAAPGETGVTMIAAHRDTHFKLLREITRGTLIQLQDTDRRWYQYRVNDIHVADSRVDYIEPLSGESKLVLVTCYPFDALIPGGPLRYVVEAELIPRS